MTPSMVATTTVDEARARATIDAQQCQGEQVAGVALRHVATMGTLWSLWSRR